MGKVEEQRLAEVRAQVLAARRAAGVQAVALQSSSASTTSSAWAQKSTTRYGRDRSGTEQRGSLSYPAHPVDNAQAPFSPQSSTSSMGIGHMSVDERIPTQQNAMNSVYGHHDQSVHSHLSIGGSNQRPTDGKLILRNFETEAHECSVSS